MDKSNFPESQAHQKSTLVFDRSGIFIAKNLVPNWQHSYRKNSYIENITTRDFHLALNCLTGFNKDKNFMPNWQHKPSKNG
ncbi:MAG: hypothetical protein ACRC8Y_03835 [Chroococcales cyanobacterium]